MSVNLLLHNPDGVHVLLTMLDAPDLLAVEATCTALRDSVRQRVPSYWTAACRRTWKRWGSWSMLPSSPPPEDDPMGEDAAGAGAGGDPPPATPPSGPPDTHGSVVLPTGFAEAKAKYARRVQQDRNARRLFQCMLHPGLRSAATNSLMSIGNEALEALQLDKDVDLTHRYMFDLIAKHITRGLVQHAIKALSAWETTPTSLQNPPLLVGAIFIAQCANPSLDSDEVVGGLAELTARAQAAVVAASLGAHTDDGFEVHAGVGVDAVLSVVNTVLFTEAGLRGATSDFYNPRNSFVDAVLRTKVGIPITLCVVYQTVCRGLGVHLWPVNMPFKFVLVHYRDVATRTGEVFVDVFDGGALRTRADLQAMLTGRHGVVDPTAAALYQPCAPTVVWQRMLRNLVGIYKHHMRLPDLSATLSLQLAIPGLPPPEALATHLMRLQVALSMHEHRQVLFLPDLQADLEVVRHAQALAAQPQAECLLAKAEAAIAATVGQLLALQAALRMPRGTLPPVSEPPRRRAGEAASLRYRVGQTMVHASHNYTGVIYGWDPVCRMPESWIAAMNVDHLARGRHQPFYNVLVSAGPLRGPNQRTYVAEDNIVIPDAGAVVDHPDVGAYFSQWDAAAGVYRPNFVTAAEYPDDVL